MKPQEKYDQISTWHICYCNTHILQIVTMLFDYKVCSRRNCHEHGLTSFLGTILIWKAWASTVFTIDLKQGNVLHWIILWNWLPSIFPEGIHAGFPIKKYGGYVFWMQPIMEGSPCSTGSQCWWILSHCYVAGMTAIYIRSFTKWRILYWYMR